MSSRLCADQALGYIQAADVVVDEIKAAGGQAVANYDSVENGERIIDTAIKSFGRIDVLINNAGVNDNLEPVAATSRQMWDKNILVNLSGPFVTSQHAIEQFLSQDEVGGQRGVILNVISAAGLHGGRAGMYFLLPLLSR